VIGIVGAGISGLSLGVFLDEAGVDFRILEAGERPGGVIRTTRSGGRVLEHGPQRTRVTPALEALIHRTGLEGELLPVPPGLPLWIYSRGRLRRAPLTPGQFLRTDLLSPLEKARVLVEPLTRGPDPDESVARFLSRKFGSEAYRALLGPLFGGIFAQDPGDMYVRHALEPVLRSLGATRSVLRRAVPSVVSGREGAGAASFHGGLQALTDALAKEVGDRLRLGVAVQGLGVSGASWTLRTGEGELQCDAVVLTVPAATAADLLEGTAPEAAFRLRRLRYNDLALVHLHSDVAVDGLGYQVAFGEDLRTRGVTFNASALGRDGIHTAFLGGSRDPELMALPDRGIGELAAKEFRRVTGGEAEVLGVSRNWIPAWDRSWTALEGLEVPPGIHLLANYNARVGIPGRVEGARELARRLAPA
jgi:protoporphyrinogen/coproporphyrinogen III oxidase